MLTFDRRYKLFIWKGDPPPIELDFSPSAGHWYTASPYIAYLLRDHATGEAAGALAPVIRRVERSASAQPVLPPTNGLFEYQAAGVEHLVDQFRAGRRHLLLSDEQGTGKSCQALVAAKEMGFKRLLIVCPASLRLNWAREVNMWHGGPAVAALDGRAAVPTDGSVITSYNLVEKAIGRAYDFLIVDECFPPETEVLTEKGRMSIKAVVDDPSVKSVATLVRGEVTLKRITGRIAKKPSHDILEVKHEFGKIRCTANHPIWVEDRGWVEAWQITEGAHLRILRRDIYDPLLGSEKQQNAPLLRDSLFSKAGEVSPRRERESAFTRGKVEEFRVSQKGAFAEPGFSESYFEAIEGEQPDGKAGGARESVRGFETYRAQTERAWGERSGDDGRAEDCCRSNQGCSGVCCSHKNFPGVFSQCKNTESLQGRRGYFTTENSGRDRRGESLLVGPAGAGCEEESCVGISRVESVTVYQQRGSYDGLVFCLKVDGPESFLADNVLVHNCHALRDHASARSRAILGDATRGWRGLVDTLPTLFLSGTPIPNGRPSELWPILYRCATDAISYMKYSAFCARFCLMAPDGRGGFMVRGAKRQDELFARLRGSGFMTRRLKSDVLHELPPKRYKMVLFPADGAMRKVLDKESAFSAAEILAHGVPVGSPLPEIRREMGLAKVPAAVEYIKDLLAAEDKVVVFAHHVEVVGLLVEALVEYGARAITGSTLPAARQASVDAFQGDASCRVLVCNIVAGGTGTTLTAGHDVVFVESSWVPGENEQAEDREHRIGQKFAVIVHQLVVEGSLDAKILGSAAHKRLDVGGVLDAT